MRRKFCLLLGLLLAVSAFVQAQELEVRSFQRLDRDLLARTQERLDLNDEPCAVLRISIPSAKDYTFEGNIVGEVIYNPGEAIVYMPAGSRNITITSDKFGSLKYDFTDRLEKQVVYKLTLKFNVATANKLRTLIMPTLSVGSSLSYGIMLGIVKKAGGYLKVKSDFGSVEPTLECLETGTTPEGTPMWFTGKTKSARLAITGGTIIRLAMPFYIYAGAGYGYRKMTWESVNSEWADNLDQTFDGIEAELGCIFRMNSFAISAGVQTNSFKYFEGNIGIGFMF